MNYYITKSSAGSWSELPVTGKSITWAQGDTQSRSAADYRLLMASGMFDAGDVDPVFGVSNSLTGGLEIIDPRNGLPLTIVNAIGGGGVGDEMLASLSSGWIATGYQWMRDGLDISGATSSAYTLTGADYGKSVSVTATGLSHASSGVKIKAATGYVLPAPILLESYDSVVGVAASGGGTLSIDTTSKVQGSGMLTVTGGGVSGSAPIAAKTGIGTYNPATFGTVACYIHTKSEAQTSAMYISFGIGAAWDSAQIQTNFGNRLMGGMWHAFNVSEVPSIAALGSGGLNLRARFTQNAPWNNKIGFDSVIANAAGRPTVVIAFDDAEDTVFDIAEPYMSDLGLKGTCYIPPNLLGAYNKLTLEEIKSLYAKNWDMACDSPSDQPYSDFGTVPSAVAAAQSVQAWLVNNGMPRAKDHMCYPGPYTEPVPTPVQIAALTGSGSTTVTCASTTGIFAGMNIYGFGIADNATVISNDSATQLTLSSVVPVQTSAAMCIDRSGTWYPGKLQAGLSGAGFKTGRNSFGVSMYTRFGFGSQAMALPGTGVTGMTLAQMKARVDEAILRGTTVVFYFHRITEAGGSINVSTANFTGLMDYIAENKNANVLDALTISELWARDGNAVLPF